MKELTKLVRATLKAYFEGRELNLSKETKEKFSEKKACFVTLTKHKELRGCIGSLVPRQELYKEVAENSLNAAFKDPRFPPLRKEELSQIHIEISILSVPKRLKYKNYSDLLEKLEKKEGVIIQKGLKSATYLPQVWGDLPDKKEFLSSLCRKAGLEDDEWKKYEIQIWTYEVDKIGE